MLISDAVGTNATSFLPQAVSWIAGLPGEGEVTGQYMEHLSEHQNCLKKEHADLTVTEKVHAEAGNCPGDVVDKRHESGNVLPSPEPGILCLLQPLHLGWAPSAKVVCALATLRIHFFGRKDFAKWRQESAFFLFSCA